MEYYKYLLVEDNENDSTVCLDTVERMNHETTDYQISIDVAKNISNALAMLKESYDGAIIDIKLEGNDNGNEVITQITEKYRLPVAIMTGTPDTVLGDESPIKIYKKGEATYEDIIKSLIEISNTGLFKVIGGKGIIENTMIEVFWRNLYPRIETWKELRKSGSATEIILLRYAIAHIHELLEDNIPLYSVEEVYISPPLNQRIRTGCILKNKEDNLFYIVLSPPCDLAIHNGKIKTDRVMLCEIDDYGIINMTVVEGVSATKRKKALLPTIRNNNKEYFHWLPKNSVFEGGYVNFRKVINYKPDELLEQFYPPELRVQDSIVKDILSRFSAYYARQGQPDFDFEKEAESILQVLFPEGQ
ncbi:response regulator [Paenibacillus sacheonensis]|uniref:Response regulator n=1 Tax=Paenibacillus sacheonensis TaxID=742054 RepID=A0A7X4YUQ1_9BACL|nr:response regulator [Paenibacillus sacheonensis]MBM7568076.1 CheY-like chemotaxis protein [Paenibacillus sacheonensis]NBC72895.1 response regulator [Paenibacillus sacheonensis]